MNRAPDLTSLRITVADNRAVALRGDESVARPRGPFIVIGMGRSGTSYVASVLHEAGIDMGEELKPADEQNEAGYFEDLEVLRMHQSWLEERGMSFVSVSDEFPLELDAARREKISSYIERRESSSRPWGLKAPGILFFWPAWQDALPETTVLLLPFRHPDGVAASLADGGMPPESALPLWMQLNRLALDALDSSPFTGVVLDFDDRPALARRLNTLLGPFVDTYRPALHRHRSRGRLPAEAEEVLAELRRRAAAG
jgi:hypothetical protein